MTRMKRVLLVGAGGKLGSMIAGAIRSKPGAELRCLVRPPSRDKVAAAFPGAEIARGDLADLDDAALDTACRGVDAVVSAVQGGPEILVEGQLRLLRAAERAGVRRFIPSDYSLDPFRLAEGAIVMSDWRRAFAARAEGTSVELVHVLCGCFLSRQVLFGFLGAIDLGAREAYLWGDGHVPMDFTTDTDTARYTAEAALDPEPLPRHFNVAGDTLTFHELVDAYAAASGQALTVVRKGSLADLDREIARRKAAEPENLVAYLPLMYWRAMLDGKGKLGPTMNGRYPSIQPTTVREYVKRELSVSF